jgi:drug/metabolite transporter (DMT)-like permease
MAGGAVLFAWMNFFARLASSSASWMTVGAVRALIGALVAIAVARMRGASLVAKDRRAIFWRSLFGTSAMLATFYALSSRTLSLGDTVTLLNLTPVFLAVLAPIFLRERTSLAVAFALALSLGGVVLILHPSFAWQDAGLTRGPAAATTATVAVLASFLASIAMMMLRRMGPTETAEAIAAHFSLFAAATLSALALFDLRLPTLRDAAFMVAAGVCAGFAQIAMTRAYALERAARVSGVGYLAVVASALLGAAVLGERPTLGAIGGMALVVSGGLLVTFTKDASDEAPAPPTR